MRDCTIFTLSNGLRVVHQRVTTSAIVHCGLVLDIGSRDESITNQGIAHFWEHMAFKGTRKRKTLDIISSLDSVGGELNAYTDKEKIAFYASVRKEYFERAIDLLSDITFHSIFPEKELEKERGVILEEMAMYLDSPDESLQDEFESVVFKNHPMGMNILGRAETINTFQKKDFVSFFKEHINTKRIVFSCVGDIALDDVERLAKKYLENFKTHQLNGKRRKFSSYKPAYQVLERTVKQAKCAIGSEAYPVHNGNRVPLYLLVNILGGPGMNSRLNLSLRERYGLVYSVDAHYIPYSDTGMFAVFFGTEPKQLDKCINLVKKEMNRFCDKPLSKAQLAAAKEQIKGQLAMSEENNLSLMLMMARSVLLYNRVPKLEEIFNMIDATDALKLQDVAQDIFDEKKLSFLTMIPESEKGKANGKKKV
ncbi:M16 family metallopeptidase [Ohtaekwangia koreensis]|uniref:Predicted Zn-dependent peptidase n=1 Tax=Ohtaekwangia koreensis TaxID=688867 RepID=A0A1T5J2E0_9BACT|nr:pitrilysin family protein [Ohtaekwangia koreensis]SKC45398.1 Predicted Zn-dependent peptidase [Ohtaekwangia koreensis]